MALTIIGTMAFDAIETPFAKTEKTIGGSGTYCAYAATNFMHSINQVSIVGGDFPQEVLQDLNRLGVNTEGVEIVKDKKSFFWSGKYHLDMNTRETLITDLNVLADFNPTLPDSYLETDYLLLGNLVPAIQRSVINQLSKRPKLIVLDTMNFWMETAMEDLEDVLKMVDVLVVNDSEARQLSGEFALVKAARKILAMGPKFLIVKKGEHGALLFNGEEIFCAPALPLEEVFDPTGAGDAFAGGFIGYLASTGDLSFENMKTAVIMGSVTASFCCEKMGTERLKSLTPEDIQKRAAKFVRLTNFQLSC
ncbi:PfkB family carbohydrate kinase [Arachidicoccus terrestris]|uniref:PfkB family carbohydrate kinase n=1 Tax=Arachidicoccus terrestris TaxID=2875539 RepID=UPI001CC72EF9|nr:PfkB family carbohydrate kinase [Arachidicoccus terrestris]UAY56461.1 sugar kinase [Arachidicoccus terrestris]